MTRKEKPLTKAVRASEQGAKNNCLQDTPFPSVGQAKVPQGNSAASQRQRVLTYLRSESLTTFQARQGLDCMHIGMRICELRKAGYLIDRVWVNDLSPSGKIHRIAKYVLRQKHPFQLSLFNQMKGGGK